MPITCCIEPHETESESRCEPVSASASPSPGPSSNRTKSRYKPAPSTRRAFETILRAALRVVGPSPEAICEPKDRASEFSCARAGAVLWWNLHLETINQPIGVSTYQVTCELPPPMQEELPSVGDLREVINKLRSEMESLRRSCPMRNKAIHIDRNHRTARPGISGAIQRSADNEHLSDSSRTAILRAVFCSHPGQAGLRQMVLDSVQSVHSKRNYAKALDVPSVPADLSLASC